MFIECLEISIRFALGLFQVHVAIFPDGLDDKGRQQEEEEKVSDPNETKYLDFETKSWKPLPSMAKLNNATKCIGAEVVSNNLYVKLLEEVMILLTCIAITTRLEMYGRHFFVVSAISSVKDYVCVLSMNIYMYLVTAQSPLRDIV